MAHLVKALPIGLCCSKPRQVQAPIKLSTSHQYISPLLYLSVCSLVCLFLLCSSYWNVIGNNFVSKRYTSWLEACRDLSWILLPTCTWTDEVLCVREFTECMGEDDGGPRALTMPWMDPTNAGFSSGGFSDEGPGRTSSLGGTATIQTKLTVIL